MTLAEVIKRYGDKKKCIELLEKVRWENGIHCPYCESAKVSHKAERNQSTRHQCQDCHKSFTVLTGTIFHSAKALPQWFMILGLMLNAKKSRTSHEVSRNIGMRQASVWEIMKKIHRAMETKESTLLKGLLEMNETYIGVKGREIGKLGRGTDKTPVVGDMVRGSKVRTGIPQQDEASNFKIFKRIVGQNVDEIKSVLITDEYKGYSAMVGNGVAHTVPDNSEPRAKGNDHTNRIEIG